MFSKLFSAIILGVSNFRVFEILEHLPYNVQDMMLFYTAENFGIFVILLETFWQSLKGPE